MNQRTTEWTNYQVEFEAMHGVHAIYFVSEMEEVETGIDLLKFRFLL